jgi:hypothetical protein
VAAIAVMIGRHYIPVSISAWDGRVKQQVRRFTCRPVMLCSVSMYLAQIQLLDTSLDFLSITNHYN